MKLHDEETKQQYQQATRCPRKIDIENEFIRFITNMINEVDRKIVKGKQRLDLMNSKLDQRPMSKQAEAVTSINDKITKLVREAEEAGIRGDVDQAQNLMGLCEKLKEDKEVLIKQYESCGFNYSETQEKQMEVCETCGAFLIVGDAQSRIDDHLMGKQHIGYTRLRKALEDHKKNAEKNLDERRSGSASSSSRRDRRPDDRSRYRSVISIFSSLSLRNNFLEMSIVINVMTEEVTAKEIETVDIEGIIVDQDPDREIGRDVSFAKCNRILKMKSYRFRPQSLIKSLPREYLKPQTPSQ